MESKSWFEVDKDGLKQLQAGKPKHYLLRELVQNAWDENVSVVKVSTELNKNLAFIQVEDDNKEGFKDLSDGYTLYKETYKRKNPEKRGRFNLGEKQAFSICEKAEIITTKGSVLFDKDGRHESTKGTKTGSIIKVWVKMTEEEYNECLKVLETYLIPSNIRFYINNRCCRSKESFKEFETNLSTEISDGEVLRKTSRKTKVSLYKIENQESFLYEMGIPVCKIECEYSIDIHQKIPLGVDRETVSQSYLRDVFSEVLNNTYEDVEEESSSQVWVREAMSDERINKDAVETILEKRYGDKVCVADPFDSNSIDEAISNGYRVIRGNEMGKEEWAGIKRFGALLSSSNLFGTNFIHAKLVTPNAEQLLVAKYAKKIAKRLLNIDIVVKFVNEREMVAAQFGNCELTFNIAKLGKSFFEKPVTSNTTDLILHELGHNAGNHTESGYHELITKMAGELVIIALKEPKFFDF